MNRQVLVDAYARCLKLGYTVHRRPGDFGLYWNEQEMVWKPYATVDVRLHLIETVLVGEDGCTGVRWDDVARTLECDDVFLRGFIDGLEFQITPDDRPT